MGFTCKVCGEEHDELPDIGTRAPWHWDDALNKDRTSRLTPDLCIIEAQDYFVRGVIEIPLLDGDHPFGWGVWVSLKKENFKTYKRHYDTPKIGPFFGWLCTEITRFSESTVGVPTTVTFIGGGERPRIFINECDHPLYRQQQTGLTMDQAWEIVHSYM